MLAIVHTARRWGWAAGEWVAHCQHGDDTEFNHDRHGSTKEFRYFVKGKKLPALMQYASCTTRAYVESRQNIYVLCRLEWSLSTALGYLVNFI